MSQPRLRPEQRRRVAVEKRRPQELQRVRQPDKGEKPDRLQVDSAVLQPRLQHRAREQQRQPGSESHEERNQHAPAESRARTYRPTKAGRALKQRAIHSSRSRALCRFPGGKRVLSAGAAGVEGEWACATGCASRSPEAHAVSSESHSRSSAARGRRSAGPCRSSSASLPLRAPASRSGSRCAIRRFSPTPGRGWTTTCTGRAGSRRSETYRPTRARRRRASATARSSGRKPEFFRLPRQFFRSISLCAMFQSPHSTISRPSARRR